MINRRVTRVVLDGAEVTSLVARPDSSGLVPVITTASEMYIGYHGKFASRFFQVSTANAVAANLTVSYWNGSAWVAVDDALDQTSVSGVPFAQSGFISWVNKEDWVASAQTGLDADVELFWIKLTWDADLNALLEIKTILNVYSDDALLRAYFPELVSDTNFLPANKTNFLDQHIAGKDLVVLRLKQRKLIIDDSQVIDPNDVAIAATYATAKIILQPIATSPAVKELYDLACKGFDEEMGKVTIAVDTNADGILSEPERAQSFSVFVSRR